MRKVGEVRSPRLRSRWRTLDDMKRVVVLGRGASGKSTLARQLSELTVLPLIELDKFFWRAGLLATPRDESVSLQEKLVATEGWIMDGDLGPYDAVEVRLRAADTIILLDFSLIAVLGEQPCDLASVLISGDGSSRIAFAAAPFSCGPSLTTLRRRISRYCGALAHSDNSSRASIARVPDETGSVNIRPNQKETLSFDPCWIKFPEGRKKRPDQGGPAPKVYEVLHPLKRRQPKPSLLTGGFDDC